MKVKTTRIYADYIVEYDPLSIFKDARRFGRWQAARFTKTDIALGINDEIFTDGFQVCLEGEVYEFKGDEFVGDKRNLVLHYTGSTFPTIAVIDK